MSVDYSHPLHAASLYIEELKYGPRDRALEGATVAQIVAQLEGLLRDAGVTHIDAATLVDDLDHYAASFATLMRVPPIVGKSIFLDGIMHGIAAAAGLKGSP